MLTIAKNLLTDHLVEYDPMPDTLMLGEEIVRIGADIGISKAGLRLVGETVLAAKEDLGDLAKVLAR